MKSKVELLNVIVSTLKKYNLKLRRKNLLPFIGNGKEFISKKLKNKTYK